MGYLQLRGVQACMLNMVKVNVIKDNLRYVKKTKYVMI